MSRSTIFNVDLGTEKNLNLKPDANFIFMCV